MSIMQEAGWQKLQKVEWRYIRLFRRVWPCMATGPGVTSWLFKACPFNLNGWLVLAPRGCYGHRPYDVVLEVVLSRYHKGA